MSDLTPALPPEAWAGPWPAWRTASRYDELGFDLRHGTMNVTASDKNIKDRVLTCHIEDPTARHALAALALWQQPFGFTHADVAFLRRNADGFRLEHALERYAELADRIAALLPPEPTP